ncbi:MAG: DNA-binding protein [Prevotella sp.]|nr:DNA-binding protein [Paraprevotella sp.]MDD5854807.1 DNA-binding protein [Prevotella sp.]MDY4407758.1 DNA-binding protein [Prevotella sp.]
MAKQESKTKSFILRIDSDTMAAIEKWAADEFRSTNGQLQWIINEALRKNGRLRTKKTNTKQNEQGDNE